jgi:hypothetical protein
VSRKSLVPFIVITLVFSVLVAFLVTYLWDNWPDAESSPDHVYAGPRNSFTADLDRGRVRAVAVDLAHQALDVTTATSTYRVDYPDNLELFSRLAEHRDVSVSTSRATSRAAVFWTALVVALSSALLTLAALRLARTADPAPA